MTDQMNNQPRKARGHSKALMITTSFYGLLYLLFIIFEAGTPASLKAVFVPSDLEEFVIKLLFLLFVVGYIAVWKNEGIGGAIFILWYVGMWVLGLLIAVQDRDTSIVLGFPLFVLSILFVVRWYKKRSVERVSTAT
jgi:hypothetical protein